MPDAFQLLMISAMYENGGNTTHRCFDGHPQAFVYPFESQLGTRLVVDHLTSMFPVKYRWPEFALAAAPEGDYRAIIDEEMKVRARTPRVSKFRDHPMEFDDEERLSIYLDYVSGSGRSRGGNVAAFFRATFDAWKDCRRTGEEAVYVGYSPIIVVDGAKILEDLPRAHVLHVVRNPWSAYADTKKRPVPLPLSQYMLAWTINQHVAVTLQAAFPDRVHLVRIEDVVEDPERTLAPVCTALGISSDSALSQPSWNGQPLGQIYPWGTIREATPEANRATARELSNEEAREIGRLAGFALHHFGYEQFLDA